MSNKLNNDIIKALSKEIEIPHFQSGQLIKLTVQQSLGIIETALNNGAFDYVATVCSRVISVAPKFANPYLVMARAQLRMGNKKYARELTEKALKLGTGNADIMFYAGQLYIDFYETDKAFGLFERAYKLSPKDPKILTFYGIMLGKKGLSDQAIQCFKKSIALAPRFTGAYIMLAVENPALIDDQMLEAVYRLVDAMPADSIQQTELLFTAARRHAADGDIDKEFACLHRANASMRKKYSHSWKKDLSDWNAIAERFTAQFINEIKIPVSNSVSPVIFATLPRSGVTLAEQILSSHSQICAAGESNLFHGAATEISISLWNDGRYWQYLNTTNAGNFLEKYLARIPEVMAEQKLDKLFVTDKSPNNYSSIGVVLSAFPNAKIIHCVREPLDVCLSCYQNYFQDGLPYTCNLEDMARMYSLFETIMTYWKTIFPDRIFTLHYENLVTNPEETIRQCLDFIGLPWEENCLDFHKQKKIVHTASVRQVQNPINRSGLARWKKYADYLQPAIETLQKGLND